MLDALYSGIQIGQNLADEGYTAIGIGSLGERSILTAFILTAAFYRSQMPDLSGSLKEKNQMKMLGAVLRTHGLDCTRPLELLQKAGAPDVANELYEYFLTLVRQDVEHVAHGVFGADMKVDLVNDGPFTIVLDTDSL